MRTGVKTMIPRKTLNDMFPEWAIGNGIIATICATGNAPWDDEYDIVSPFPLDLEYHGNRSGSKYLSPLVERLYAGDGDYPNAGDDNVSARNADLADVILRTFGANWAKLWATYSLEYNPIENYSMVEEMNDDVTETEYGHTRTRTNNLSHAKTGTETQAPNTTQTSTPGVTTTTENGIFGFNEGETSSPANDQTVSRTGFDTIAMTGTDTLTYNTYDNDTGTQADADTGKDTHTRNYELTRKGNIGVTTSQQMIESERNLWYWNFFRDVVFPDLDRVLTLQIY